MKVTKEVLKEKLKRNICMMFNKELEEASSLEIYQALSKVDIRRDITRLVI